MKEKKKTILVVDDDVAFRRAVKIILTAKGYHMLEVNRSIPVIKTILSEKPDLILLDLYMPHAGGQEILNTMKRTNIDIPVIIISGLISELDFQILREKGVMHFLAKPIDSKILTTKVSEVLGSITDA